MERGVPQVESRSLTDQASRDEPPAGKPLAVFDGDGTLFRRGLLPELTRRLVDEGGFSERAREELSRDYYVWIERRGSYESYDNLVVDLFQRDLKGVSVEATRNCAGTEVEGGLKS
jgi:phosphoserine phosphatase